MEKQIELNEKITDLLVKLSRLCPSGEGLGGHAHLQAFLNLGNEARKILEEVEKPDFKMVPAVGGGNVMVKA